MRKIYLLFFLFPLFSIAQKLEGQPLIDSLLVELPKMREDTLKVNLLNDLGYSYRDVNIDELIKYTNVALKLSKKLNYNYGIIESHRNIGVYYLGIDYAKSKYNFGYVLKNAKNKSQIAKAYYGLGILSSKEGNFPKSSAFYFKGLKIAEDAKDHKLYAKLLLNIGVNYHYASDFDKAISYYEKGLEYNKKHQNIGDDNLRLHHIAKCNIEKKQYDKALKYIIEAQKINDKLGLLKFKAACNNLKADIYGYQEKYTLALEIYKQSLQIYLKLDDEDFIAHTYSRIAEVNTDIAINTKCSNKEKKNI